MGKGLSVSNNGSRVRVKDNRSGSDLDCDPDQ